MRELDVVVPGEPPLAGTLTLPDGGSEPVPGMVIASGSGPLDRNSDVKRMRFETARQLAHALAGAGIASLRYDKRGVGGSRGEGPSADWRTVGFHDNADDLARALTALAERPEIDARRILLGGHSEGALLAASVAARTGGDPATPDGARIAGVVLLAGSATPGEDLLRWQAREIAPTLPAPVRTIMRLFGIDLEKKVAANHVKIKATTTDVARIGAVTVNARWMREFMAHDPRTDLARISAPVLALTGAKDLQTNPDDLDVIAATVPGRVEVHRVPDLTHTLRIQPGPPSLKAYKKELREPVNRDVLEAVVQWCRQVAGLGPEPTAG